MRNLFISTTYSAVFDTKHERRRGEVWSKASPVNGVQSVFTVPVMMLRLVGP